MAENSQQRPTPHIRVKQTIEGNVESGATVIGVQQTIKQHFPEATFPIVSLPAANAHFTGRVALLNQLQAASQKRQPHIAITQAIAGMGGVGKTQLALAFAYRHQQAYDLIWWLNGSDTTQLDGGLLALGQRLQLPLPEDDLPTARQIVLSWLAAAANGGCLSTTMWTAWHRVPYGRIYLGDKGRC